MAALGWLLNLDFAASGVPDGIGGEAGDEQQVMRRAPYAYSYGYYRIVRGVTWMMSLLVR